MGFLLISLILLAVGIILLYNDRDFGCVPVTVGVAGILMCTLLMILAPLDAKRELKIYDNLVTTVESVEFQSDAVIHEVLEINENIIESKELCHNFMTLGFYSTKIADLELITIPNDWKEAPPEEPTENTD